MICKYCNNQLAENAAFCNKCGAKVEIMPVQPAVAEVANFCTVCGTDTKGGNFCPSCGAAVNSALPPAFAVPQRPINPNNRQPLPIFSNKKALIASAAGLITIIIIGVVVFNILNTPLLVLNRALNNTAAEIQQRTSASPLLAANMLPAILDNGVISANVAMAGFWGEAISPSMTLRTDQRNNNHALNFTVGQQSMDLHLNRQRVAFRNTNLDDNFYGITFSTFQNDLASIIPVLGINSDEENFLTELISAIETSMNRTPTQMLQPYQDSFVAMLIALPVTSERQSVVSGGTLVNATRLTFTVSQENITALLHDWLALFEEELALQPNISQNELRELRNFVTDTIRTFERDFNVSSEMVYYIRNNRLLRAEFEVNLTYQFETAQIVSVVDFGTSVQSPWHVNTTITNLTRNESVQINVGWDFSETPTQYINTFNASIREGNFLETATATLAWSPTSGNFALSLNSGGSAQDILTGVFMPNSAGSAFDLSLNLGGIFAFLGASSVNITASTNANIPNINFINLDGWGDSVLARSGVPLMAFFGLGGAGSLIPFF
ncbi:MAG: zinc ribbon domain-containing protein [Defluviitaleaceae bacterium]|nr:zinc ribbon domain-containing protein [Defluviitaleaceae bacterium]